MKIGGPSDPFIEGVILAAQYQHPKQSDVLIKDKWKVTSHCMEVRAAKQGSKNFLEMEIPIGVANKWLNYRKDKPSGLLSSSVLRGPDICPSGRLFIAKHAQDALRLVPDPKFVRLFAGTQVYLQNVQSSIEPDLLETDWKAIPELYSNLATIYRKNGVSPDGIRLLVAQELMDFRLTNMFTSLTWNSLFGARELRYGLLRVTTTPTKAKVTVDTADWGESPLENLIAKGLHHVSAEKSKRKGADDVQVKAAQQNHVDIKLQ